MAAGDLLGLRLADGVGLPAGAVLLAALLVAASAALPAARGRGPTARRRAPPPPTVVLLAACGLAGFAAGLSAGRAAAASCLADLEPRAAVRATGIAEHDVRPAAGRRGGGDAGGDASAHAGRWATKRSGWRTGAQAVRSRRLELRSVRIRSGGRSCRVPRLLARVVPGPVEVTAGSPVRVAGRWIRFDGSGPPVRPLGRYGMARGRLVADGPAGRDDAGGRPPGADASAARGGPTSALVVVRARAARRLDALLPPDVAPLARALVLARRSGLAPDVSRRFADAGMAHLLAISGLHVGILAGGALWVIGRVAPGRVRYPLAAGLVGGYVGFIGAPAAATRAAVLFGGWAAGRYRGASARPTELLGAAAAAVLLADPAALLGAGFQLSFAGFSGLLLGAAVGRRLTGAVRRAWRPGAPRWRSGLVAVAAGAGAFAATAPFAAHHFQRAAPVAVAANFVGAPLVTLALAALVGVLALPGPLAALAGDAAGTVLRTLLAAVDFFAGLPFGHGTAAPPGPVAWAVAACLAVAAVRVARGLPAARAAVPAGLAAAVGLAGGWASSWPGPDGTLLCQLDVGQGDAAVVRTRRGHWLAFDAGPRFGGRDAGLRIVAPFMRDRGARALELFVLSHPDVDHLGGAGALLERFRVGGVLDAGNPAASGTYAAFLDAVAEEGARWLPATAGARVRVDEVAVTVLAPEGDPDGLWRGRPRDRNEASVAVRVTVGGGFAYLNPGDATADQEEGMLERWPADSLRAVVLKAGHHGSRTSTGRRWLEAVAPRLAVVSAGAGNPYGHPHPEVLRRLEAAGVGRVWRTDRDGHLCLEVAPDGAWRVRGEKRWRPGAAAADG